MRIPQIQALRALAAILVLLFHANLAGGGYVGVDIFYVISGYLITGLLLREIEKTGGLNFRAFYLRRAKRLLPTSFSILMITALAAWVLYPGTMREDLGRHIFAGYKPRLVFACATQPAGAECFHVCTFGFQAANAQALTLAECVKAQAHMRANLAATLVFDRAGLIGDVAV